MKERTEMVIKEKQIAFVGRVTASISHEIKNTLAIIQESAGLLGDLLQHEPASVDRPARDRLTKIVTAICEQVRRSDEIVKRLNRFAHSLDKPLAYLELNGLLLEIGEMAQRFASLNGAELKVNPSTEPIQIHGDPFCMRYLIFNFVECALKEPGESKRVTVSSDWSENTARVSIIDRGRPRADRIMKGISLSPSHLVRDEGEDETELALLGKIVKDMGGGIKAEDLQDGGTRVTIFFPTDRK